MIYLLIAVSGFIGANMRFFITNTSYIPLGDSFLDTLLVNTTGSFLICLFMTLSLGLINIKSEYKIAIATGLLGAYTTFSAFSMEVFIFFAEGNLLAGTLYLMGTPILCVSFGWLGLVIGKKVNENFKQGARGEIS